VVSKLTIEKKIDTVEKETATVEKETTNKLTTIAMLLTHATYVHWLADPDKSGQAVHSAVFVPAFTLSQGDSE